MRRGVFRWVVDRELLLTAALGPLFIFPGTYTLTGFVLVAGLWLLRWRVRGRFSVRLPTMDACVLVLLLMLLVSQWASVDPSVSWPLLYRILWGVALFYAVVNGVQSEAQGRLVVCGLLAVVTLISLISLIGTTWFWTKLIALPIRGYLPALITDASAFPGGAFHPNVIAGTLAPFVPLAISVGFLTEGGGRLFRGQRAALLLLVLLLSCTVFLTQSRGGWMGLGVGMLLFMLLLNRRGRWLVLLCDLVILVAVGVSGRAELWKAFLRLDTTGTGTLRLEVWNRALYMIRDMPFTGIGLGTFPLILDAFYPSFLGGPHARIDHAHNLFLQVAVDLGLPGMIAFSILFVTSLGMALQAYQEARPRSFLHGLSAGACGALLVVAFHGFFDAPLWVARSSPLLWVLLSLGPISRGMSAAD
jgi:putative inorganic carbon (HCO3(-)) transporter